VVVGCSPTDFLLTQEQQPSRGYFIAGTWTKWRAIKMENEGWTACGNFVEAGIAGTVLVMFMQDFGFIWEVPRLVSEKEPSKHHLFEKQPPIVESY